MMKTILCTGMMRSASTWSFNVCRLLGKLQADREKIPFGSSFMELETLERFLDTPAAKTRAIGVIKAHTPTERVMQMILRGDVKSVCTIRDPRDCIASHKLFGQETFAESVQSIVGNLRNVDRYRETNSTLFVRYEEMRNDPAAQICIIADYLEINVGDAVVQQIDAETGIEKSRQISEHVNQLPPEQTLRYRQHAIDRLTNLHENHIHGGFTGRWKNELTDEEQLLVNQQFAPWLVKLNYETDKSIEWLLRSSG